MGGRQVIPGCRRKYSPESDTTSFSQGSSDEFMNGLNAIWSKGPFSDVGLQRGEGSAADRIARLDTLMSVPTP
jgi:hypothetical protein